jgi:DNA-binding GntR family transcriptional regulator
MRLLSAAMHAAVDGVAAGDVRSVEHALHAVHAAKEDTEAALEHGYKPPKSGDMKRFKELDEAFHGNLERLADASRANDVAKTADAIGPPLSRQRWTP